MHRHFGFAMATLLLFRLSRTCKNFNFFLLHCPSRNAISSKVFNEFSKTCSWAERLGMWLLLVKKLKMHRPILVLQYATFKTFPTSRKCKNFNFSHYTVPAEMSISSKVFNEFEKFFLAERWGMWLFCLKIWNAHTF